MSENKIMLDQEIDIKLKKLIDFCQKYPETILGYVHGIDISFYFMKDKPIPQIDYFAVADIIKMYNDNPNVLSKYKNLKNDWNELLQIEKK